MVNAVQRLQGRSPKLVTRMSKRVMDYSSIIMVPFANIALESRGLQLQMGACRRKAELEDQVLIERDRRFVVVSSYSTDIIRSVYLARVLLLKGPVPLTWALAVASKSRKRRSWTVQ